MDQGLQGGSEGVPAEDGIDRAGDSRFVGDSVWGWSTYPDEGFTGAHPSKEHAIAEARDSLGTDYEYSNVYVQEGRYEDVGKIAPSSSSL